uniref:Uncharacterized protein n=1 Tax=Sphenodon punctatus TaxID=8508 RepID=A0A8D0GLP0_SPHPU
MGTSEGHSGGIQTCALGESHIGPSGAPQQGYCQGSILHCAHGGDNQHTHLLQQGRASLSVGINIGKRPNPEEETQSIGPKVQRQSSN